MMNKFLRRLERLAAFMRAVSMDVTHRIERYAKILTDLENAVGDEFGTFIELTEDEKKDFLSRLNSDIYRMVSKKRNYLILRLDSFVSAKQHVTQRRNNNSNAQKLKTSNNINTGSA